MSQCTCGDQKKTCRLGCFSHLYMSPSSGTQVTRLVLQAPHLLSPSLSQPLYFSIHVLQLNSRSLIDLFAINKQITIQAIPTANEAGRLTADLHLSPCSSKSNPPVALQQNTLPQPPFSSCIHFRGITIFPSKLLCPNCFVSTPKFIRHFQRTQRPL